MTLRIHLGLGATVVLLGAASTLSAAPGATAAAWPGAEGVVAYVSGNPDHANALDIYAIARDGSGRVNLTNDPARDQDPAWSPDGTKIAFASGRDEVKMDIWVADADGSDPRNLTPLTDTTESGEAGTEPAWSPDGTKIAYSYQGDVWVMRASSGGGKRNLTHDPALPAAGISPAWSPDGKTIAYIREGDIWLMSPSGKNKRQITFTTGGLGTEKSPEWSPDGLRMIYERSGQIWTMNRDGSDQRAIAAGPDQGGSNPAWSPEGDWVVFSSSGYTAPNEPDLFLARPDGTDIKRLRHTGAGADTAPAWQSLPSSDPASTYLTLVATVTGTRVTVQGELFNANPGQLVRIQLQRHDGVRFRVVERVDETVRKYGDYSTSFRTPDAATCKLVVRFVGDVDSRPASKRVEFDC